MRLFMRDSGQARAIVSKRQQPSGLKDEMNRQSKPSLSVLLGVGSHCTPLCHIGQAALDDLCRFRLGMHSKPWMADRGQRGNMEGEWEADLAFEDRVARIIDLNEFKASAKICTALSSEPPEESVRNAIPPVAAEYDGPDGGF